LIGHQPLNRRRPIPTGIVPSSLIPTELPYWQTPDDIVHRHSIKHGIDEHTVRAPIPHASTASFVLTAKGHNCDDSTRTRADHDATPILCPFRSADATSEYETRSYARLVETNARDLLRQSGISEQILSARPTRSDTRSPISSPSEPFSIW